MSENAGNQDPEGQKQNTSKSCIQGRNLGITFGGVWGYYARQKGVALVLPDE